jgi:phosphate uptake regulator
MEIAEYNLIAWYLEMIGDRLNSVCINLLKLENHKKQSDRELLERLGQLALVSFTMFDKAMKSIVDKDLKLASDAVDLYEAVQLEEEKLLTEFHSTNPELTTRFNMIAWEFKIIAEHSSAIAEISIDNILRGKNKICQVWEESNSVK